MQVGEEEAMKERNNLMSRRRLLKAAMWAAPLSLVEQGTGRSSESISQAREEIIELTAQAVVEQIIDRGGQPRGASWIPLIAGEDVRRYCATPSRVIRVDVRGIAYKDPAIYKGPKLLVRKTGIGISAAVDRTDSFTTQVVFHYKPLRGSGSALNTEGDPRRSRTAAGRSDDRSISLGCRSRCLSV